MKKKISFILCSIILLLNTTFLYATGSVSLPKSQFLGDSGDSSALLGEYKGLTELSQ